MNMYLCSYVFLSIWLAEDALVSTYTEQMEQYVPIWRNYLSFNVLNPMQFYINGEKNDRFKKKMAISKLSMVSGHVYRLQSVLLPSSLEYL
jgi:hypothetical protein